MKTWAFYISLIVCLGIQIPFAKAQQAIQVVSTTQNESFDWNENSKLFINGELANIHLSTYEGSTVKCEIIRASRHSNKEQAEKDLKKLKILASQSNRTITLRNYVELRGSDKKPQSKLKTTYHIRIPAKAKGSIEIWNYFGTVSIDGISNSLELKLEFSNLSLTGFSGSAEVEMKYGEAKLKNISGSIEMTSNRTNIEVEHLSGSADIEATYAEMRLLKIKEAKGLSVDADKSEIFIDIPTDTFMGYQITTQNVEVNQLSDKEMEMKSEPNGNHRYSYKPTDGSPTAEINLNTGTLNYIVQ